MSKGTRITKRWIDAEGIMRACYGSYLTTGNKAYSEIIALVEAVPTADVEEVRHGHWDGDSCSVCWFSWCDVTYDAPQMQMPYCPNCGSRMDLDGEEE